MVHLSSQTGYLPLAEFKSEDEPNQIHNFYPFALIPLTVLGAWRRYHSHSLLILQTKRQIESMVEE